MGHTLKYQLIIMVAAIISARANSITMTLTGATHPTDQVQNYQILRECSSIELNCLSSHSIRIGYLLFGMNQTSPSRTGCTSYQPTLDSCEGKRGSCYLELFNNSTENCTNINEISISFYCVSNSRVHSMCDRQSITATHAFPVYLTTPYFTDSVGYYSSDSNCQCDAVPSGYGAVTVNLLYARLEKKYSSSSLGTHECYDYVSFGTNAYALKYCYEDLSLRGSINRTYPAYSTVMVKFGSDPSVNNRGAWLVISPERPGFTVSISCQPFFATTTTTTTTTFTTELPWYLRTTTYKYFTSGNTFSLSPGTITALAGSLGSSVLLIMAIAVGSYGIYRRRQIALRMANQQLAVHFQGAAPVQNAPYEQPVAEAAAGSSGPSTATDAKVDLGSMPPPGYNGSMPPPGYNAVAQCPQ